MPSSGLLVSELALVFRRRRTWAMLLALGAVPALIALAVRFTSGPPAGRGPAFLDRVAGNGLFVALVAMLVEHPAVPAAHGCRGRRGHHRRGGRPRDAALPADRAGSRPRLLLVEVLRRAAVFCVAAVAHGGAVRRGLGLLLFPMGPVTLLSGDTIALGEALLRLRLVAAYVAAVAAGLCGDRPVRVHPDRRAGGRDGGHGGALPSPRRSSASSRNWTGCIRGFHPPLAGVRRPAA